MQPSRMHWRFVPPGGLAFRRLQNAKRPWKFTRASKRLHRINLINEIRNLTFPAAGEYSLLVEIDDEVLLATNLTVTG